MARSSTSTAGNETLSRSTVTNAGQTRTWAGWVRGDHFGLEIPAEPADLGRDGTPFLTAAFRASGALGPDNAVTGITRFEELAVGGTGRKLILSVDYAVPSPDLPTDLFIKFSRNSDDPARDRHRHHMNEEIMLAVASRAPGFPVRIPRCMFADFEAASGTGLLITERVRYGENGVEQCHVKCQDYDLDDSLDYYRTLVGALARLSGSFKSGAISGDISRFFPDGSANIFAKYRISGQLERILKGVDRIEQFDRDYPQLIYHADDAGAFFRRMRERVVPLVENADRIERHIHRDEEYVSLCHFNANIDNAWFWTDPEGQRQCGLLDWGMVGQMHVGLAFWGCLSGAEVDIWDHHIDELVVEFVRVYSASGGPVLDPQKLKHHLHLFAVFMALSSLMNAPTFVRNEIPDLRRDATRFDSEFDVHENSRVQLHILNNFLHIWDKFDFAWLRSDIINAA